MKQTQPRPDAVLIAGPTASGKSQLALEMADRFGGSVVNTDSMQVYPVLRILTARPSPEDEARMPHHLYGHAVLEKPYSVAEWLKDVAPVLNQLWQDGRVPVLVGGTGLYFKALEGGLADVPAIPDGVRAEVRQALITNGSENLHRMLQEYDLHAAKRLRSSDGQRIARALEVVLATGKPLAEFQAESTSVGLLDGKHVERIVLEPERPVLHSRIGARTEQMIEQGAIDEVRELLDLDLPENATVLRAIGVAQIKKLIRDEENLKTTVENLKTLTRQYAKRQSTWFRGQFGNDWKRISAP